MVCIDKKTKVMVVLGTRQDAIKAAPIIDRLRRRNSDFEPIIVTISHVREVLDHVLTLFDIDPDIALNLTHIRQGLPSLTSHVLENMTIALETVKPDILLTEGNSAPAFASSLAAFNQKIPVARIASHAMNETCENQPFEDVNRRLTTVMAEMHFAATCSAKHCLIKEGARENKILVTGSPLIDAWDHLSGIPFTFPSAPLQLAVAGGKRLILFATGSARLSSHEWQTVWKSASALVNRFADVEAVIALSSDSAAEDLFDGMEQGRNRIHLINTPDEVTFVNLLKNSYLIITDSDQIPEDASTFQKPIFIFRDTGNRKPGVNTLSAKTVECDSAAIVREAGFLLKNSQAYRKMQDMENPYGDGHAADRIVNAIQRWSKNHRHLLTPAEEFSPGIPFTELLCQNL